MNRILVIGATGRVGCQVLALVWTAPPATVAPALERIVKHVRRTVFLSAPLKTPHPLFQQPNPLRALAEQIERQIRNSGVEWTFLRPGMFAANALSWRAPQLRAGADTVCWPYLATPTAPIDERDIAAVGVRALCEDGQKIFRRGQRILLNSLLYEGKSESCRSPQRSSQGRVDGHQSVLSSRRDV